MACSKPGDLHLDLDCGWIMGTVLIIAVERRRVGLPKVLLTALVCTPGWTRIERLPSGDDVDPDCPA